MSEEINQRSAEPSKISSNTTEKVKPPKAEDKPFEEFIHEELIPSLQKSITEKGCHVEKISFFEGERPVVGGNCWIVKGDLEIGRRFWITFSSNKITSNKNIILAEPGSEPCLVESFLIDEKKITLTLLVSRTMQRLNGQKWLGAN